MAVGRLNAQVPPKEPPISATVAPIASPPAVQRRSPPAASRQPPAASRIRTRTTVHPVLDEPLGKMKAPQGGHTKNWNTVCSLG